MRVYRSVASVLCVPTAAPAFAQRTDDGTRQATIAPFAVPIVALDGLTFDRNGKTGGLRVDHTQSMGSAVPGPLSGRAHERAAVLEVVHSALGGRPQALLLHGEAGVGKTALVRSVVEELRTDGVQVLWGQGLRFGAVEAMY